MRHKFLFLTVKKMLKSVYIYGSYRKIKTGLSLFLDHSVNISRGRIKCEVRNCECAKLAKYRPKVQNTNAKVNICIQSTAEN